MSSPQVSEQTLQRGDRVLCFTDGLIEEHQRRRGTVRRGTTHRLRQPHRARPTQGVRAVVRALSHALKQERGGITSDDATLFLIEWRGGAADHLATLD